mmetsp:Transcript_13682/g.16972  ORF Transcript_13682/g.16972 Transcript_13682/m.16972 type:complete len:214 (-) Transcript_13682:1062-1703(-)|eukprot:CAMPEP_0204829374 /NCGR_PEP_ID=MMETSP1346-20131115/7496_1 /ASSEMBLY_ACC=CAM_ASM_000771 /TAXON_ID=215587 /ORGANISM="Aplanochytrium stocchinoi, Strain GSBS06" /LENGTH=213 /DNA_ID=CAMNT_0051959095 /DNA_START=106 /DNA_END=747 /DNA_ORIENTATION=-
MAAGGGFKPQMLLPLAVVYGMNNVDKEDPQNIFYARVFFVLNMVFNVLFWLYIYTVVKARNDQTVLKISESDLQPSNALADALKPKEEEKDDEKTDMKVVEYDIRKVLEKAKQLLIQSAVIAGVHYKWGHLLPLVISSVSGLVGLADDALVRIYVFGAKEEHSPELKRPFKSKSPFSDLTEAFNKAKEEADVQVEAEEKKQKKKEKKESKKTK